MDRTWYQCERKIGLALNIHVDVMRFELDGRKEGGYYLNMFVPTKMYSQLYSQCYMLQDNLLPSGQRSQEGFSISLDRVDRHQAGVYQCTASNGVGNPVTVDMQLDILCEYLQ